VEQLVIEEPFGERGEEFLVSKKCLMKLRRGVRSKWLEGGE
jgi:hypothetical protein